MARGIADKLRESDTTLTQIPGVGPFIAAKILGEVGEVSRIRSKAFVRSAVGDRASGRFVRSDPSASAEPTWKPPTELALHYIALVQSRTTPEAKAYLARQREAGKSHKEAMRCLKRHLSNVVYRHLLVDARRLERAT